MAMHPNSNVSPSVPKKMEWMYTTVIYIKSIHLYTFCKQLQTVNFGQNETRDEHYASDSAKS